MVLKRAQWVLTLGHDRRASEFNHVTSTQTVPCKTNIGNDAQGPGAVELVLEQNQQPQRREMNLLLPHHFRKTLAYRHNGRDASRLRALAREVLERQQVS